MKSVTNGAVVRRPTAAHHFGQARRKRVDGDNPRTTQR